MEVKKKILSFNIKLSFAEITELKLILEDIQADPNADCFYFRKELIKQIEETVYGSKK